MDRIYFFLNLKNISWFKLHVVWPSFKFCRVAGMLLLLWMCEMGETSNQSCVSQAHTSFCHSSAAQSALRCPTFRFHSSAPLDEWHHSSIICCICKLLATSAERKTLSLNCQDAGNKRILMQYQNKLTSFTPNEEFSALSCGFLHKLILWPFSHSRR